MQELPSKVEKSKILIPFNPWYNEIAKWGPRVVFLVLIVIAIYRAATLSLTHDESATWLMIQQRSVLSTIIDPEAWYTANNHLLNSLAIDFNTFLFGQSDLVVRLHSIIAFILYGVSAIFLIKNIYRSPAARMLAFGLIFFNPYLFDFFSLARGYGLSVGFNMASLAVFFLWLKEEKLKYLILTFTMLGLASLSLFTHLIFFPVFLGVLWVYIYIKRKEYSRARLKSLIVAPTVTMAIFLLIVYVPITSLISSGEFSWGTDSLIKSFMTLVNDSLDGRKYFGSNTDGILLGIIVALIISGIGYLKANAGKSIDIKARFQLIILSLFVLFTITLISSKLIIGTQYPINRKSTIYLPILFLVIPYGLEWITSKGISVLVGIVLLSLPFIHFQDKLQLYKTREWYYDYMTKDYILQIADESRGDTITVGNHWSHHWSSLYYIRTRDLSHLSLVRYYEEPDKSLSPEYYIIPNKDFHHFEEDYDIHLGPNSSQIVVLKRK